MGVHITYINYASGNFLKSQKYSLNNALKLGCVDEVFSYTFSDIDTKFHNDNKEILNNKKGGGYWLWKPYFILKSLNKTTTFGKKNHQSFLILFHTYYFSTKWISFFG